MILYSGEVENLSEGISKIKTKTNISAKCQYCPGVNYSCELITYLNIFLGVGSMAYSMEEKIVELLTLALVLSLALCIVHVFEF